MGCPDGSSLLDRGVDRHEHTTVLDIHEINRLILVTTESVSCSVEYVRPSFMTASKAFMASRNRSLFCCVALTTRTMKAASSHAPPPGVALPGSKPEITAGLLLGSAGIFLGLLASTIFQAPGQYRATSCSEKPRRRHDPKYVQCKGNSDIVKDMAFHKWT